MNHTPGPWSSPDGRICGQTALVAMVMGAGFITEDEINANRALIAAAPDLLAVAEGCLGFFEYMRDQKSEFTPDEPWLARLRAVIASARTLTGCARE